MLLHESSTAPNNIINLPKHYKFFQNKIWTSQYRSAVIKLFRIRINSKKRNLGNNLIEVIKYDKPIYKYKHTELYQEFKKLDVGTVNWYSLISSKARYFISQVDNLLFNRLYYNIYKKDYLAMYDTKYDNLYEYALDNEKYDLLTEDHTALKDGIYQDNVVLGQNIPLNYMEKYKRLLNYAFYHDQSMLNEDKTDLSDDAILNYLLLDQPVPTPTIDKIRRSCHRSYEYIIDYARCNADRFYYFVTLTFAEKEQKEIHEHYNNNRDEYEPNMKFKYVNDPKDYDECIKSFYRFRDNLKKQLKKKGIELYYLGVPEYQENGNIHFHLLMSEIPIDYLIENPSWLDFDYKINERRYGNALKLWKYGKSEIEPIKDQDKAITYFAGYLMKSVMNLSETEYLDRLNKNRFYKSQNLIKPDITINDDYQDEYDDIYYTTYKNNFNQSQTDKILFTLQGVHQVLTD